MKEAGGCLGAKESAGSPGAREPELRFGQLIGLGRLPFLATIQSFLSAWVSDLLRLVHDRELFCRDNANCATDSTIGETLRPSSTGNVQSARARCCLAGGMRGMGF